MNRVDCFNVRSTKVWNSWAPWGRGVAYEGSPGEREKYPFIPQRVQYRANRERRPLTKPDFYLALFRIAEPSHRIAYRSKTQEGDDKRWMISGLVLTISLKTVAIDAS
jgi:hypothetical protein